MKWDHTYNLLSAAFFFLAGVLLVGLWQGLQCGVGALLFTYGLDASPYAWKAFLRWKYDLDETNIP